MKKRIIIIGKNHPELEVLKILLIAERYEVITASHATQLVSVPGDEPDLIIIDQWIDYDYGDNICLKLKTAAAPISLMLIPATNDLSKIEAVCRANAFLSKPFEANELIDLINQFFIKDSEQASFV